MAPLVGSRRVLAFLRVLFRKYRRLDFHLHEVPIDGARACALRNEGVTVIGLRDGKIVFLSDYFKDTSFV